jgi:hypothetical protein
MATSKFHTLSGILLAGCGLCFCAAAVAADASIYKWTDLNGIVNYSNKAPPTQHADRLSQDKLSVVAMRKVSDNEVRAMNQRLENRRINELENELAQSRAIAEARYEPSAEQAIVYYPGTGYLPDRQSSYYQGSVGSRPFTRTSNDHRPSHRPIYRNRNGSNSFADYTGRARSHQSGDHAINARH